MIGSAESSWYLPSMAAGGGGQSLVARLDTPAQGDQMTVEHDRNARQGR